MDHKTQESDNASPSSMMDWDTINREWRDSGLTQKAFCEEHNLTLSTFVYHRGKILEKQDVLKPRRFTKVKINNESSPLPNRDLTIHLPNNIRLSVPPNFSTNQIKGVLAALGMSVC